MKLPMASSFNYCWSRTTVWDHWLLLNNKNPAGVKHQLWGPADLEEPGQTESVRTIRPFPPQQDHFQPQPETSASLQQQTGHVNWQKRFEEKQINKFLPLKIDNIIRKQQMHFRVQYARGGERPALQFCLWKRNRKSAAEPHAWATCHNKKN